MQARRPAIGFQLLAVAALCVSALPAAGWTLLYCFYANGWSDPAPLPPFPTDEERAVADAFWPGNTLENYIYRPAITLVWVIAVAAYMYWVRRNRTGLAMTILPVAIFGYASWNLLGYAYPVCNAL